MPFQRLVPALLLAATWLVLGTAQRLLLAWLLWPRLQATPADAFEALARGARLDLACAALPLIPLALWSSILPERAWRHPAHRRAAAAGFFAGLLGIVTLVTVDALQFLVHHARLAAPVRQRLDVAWGLLAGDAGRAGIAGVTALGCGVATVALALLLRRPFRAAWDGPSPPVLRARDLILVVAACAGGVALRPVDLPFPGRPVLGEIADSSVPALARSVAARLRS